MLEEFRKFIERGNVMDLAVGIIIGGAFQKIVSSLVEDIITPLISIPLGKMDFSHLTAKIGSAEITYGNFITAVIDFLIMAFVIFLIIRYMNKMNEKLKNISHTISIDKKAKKLAKKAEKLAKKTGIPVKQEKAPEPAPEPTTKICPFCFSEINIKASRCPHCTSILEDIKNENNEEKNDEKHD